ncbi:MAG: 1,4-dihydroxy-2-naphthoate polyprenyltransferase [Cytophagales bacterium]|uniref:1,4-dihydroxy-2-naphthoate polyprenyltransferase n=1 Tax=Cyclobacterium marinum TaxID=104 RepID=UPI0011ED4AFB|nr:1,4-dihydroxy-2-naphthoate polyprenyltransferase [Cyclobacterium marinum]MBI0398168.1 1,4-dihydroxy-2-naphthoate polyprenyltransferase [Cyclobacterium marinum]MBR9777774.1 1,4-dihydroxy-2-naphthoate polyprenyltransferase [Cytophagales bacterium]
MTIFTKKQAWIHALRLRTLPLALSSIFMGSFIAYQKSGFRWSVLIMAAITTTLLQILSNLANDYGDSINGADHEGRQGPIRAVQSGLIKPAEMKVAVILFSILSLFSGLFLLYLALEDIYLFLLFLGIGISAIIAAIAYTSGKRPYGYAGLGDISVFLFFGCVGVMGTYYLHTLSFDPTLWLPAAAIGLLSTAVLNINNIRDIQSDKAAGKLSIPVRIGKKAAENYHWGLIISALVLLLLFVIIEHAYGALAYLLMAPSILKTGWAVAKFEAPEKLDPYLKVMAMSTLFCVLFFGIGWLIF